MAAVRADEDVGAEVTTYPEMDAKIAGLLRLSAEPAMLYAAQRLEELGAALTVAESLAEEYKREWDSCCERERARWEREKEQDALIARFLGKDITVSPRPAGEREG